MPTSYVKPFRGSSHQQEKALIPFSLSPDFLSQNTLDFFGICWFSFLKLGHLHRWSIELTFPGLSWTALPLLSISQGELVTSSLVLLVCYTPRALVTLHFNDLFTYRSPLCTPSLCAPWEWGLQCTHPVPLTSGSEGGKGPCKHLINERLTTGFTLSDKTMALTIFC